MSQPDARPLSNEDALEYAIGTQDVDQIKRLLETARASGKLNASFLESQLAISAKKGHSHVVRCILDETKDVFLSRDLVLPLSEAIAGGHVEVVDILVGSGAPLDVAPGGQSAVLMAALGNHPHIVRLLISRGADVDFGTHARTVLHALASDPNWMDTDGNVLDLILRHTRDADAKDSFDNTPLHIACQMGKLEFAQKLLKNPSRPPPSLTALNDIGYTALHIAAKEGYIELTRLLLSHGANPNVRDREDWTPLHIACDEGFEGVVHVLLDQGAGLNARTSKGFLPLHVAIAGGKVDMVKVLVRRKDLETRDTFGKHAFFMAWELEQREIMELLSPSSLCLAGALSLDQITVCQNLEATIVPFYKEGFLGSRSTTSIYDLMYTQWLREAPYRNPFKADGTSFKWIHLPANNPAWIELLLMQWALNGGDEANAKAIGKIHNLVNHSHRGQYPHSRFQRPTCQIFGRNLWASMPYLHFETGLHFNRIQKAIAAAEKGVPVGPLEKDLKPDGLIRAYLHSGLHIRRTLDQFYYPNMDTQERDHDQVVQRYQVRMGHDNTKLYMVDQLWVLVLDEKRVITSFPQVWEQPEHDRLNILTEIVNQIGQGSIHSVHELVARITDRCCGIFDRHVPFDEEYQFLGMFDASLGLAASREAQLFETLRKASSQASKWLKSQRGPGQSVFAANHEVHDGQKWEDNPRFLDDFLDYGPETNLLFEVKDIRDELNMISTVLDQQRMVLGELGSHIFGVYREPPDSELTFHQFQEQDRSIEIYLKDLQRMDQQAAHLYDTVASLLDLKQKHANPFEARLAREQAAGTARQSKTIMIFTIVTIIFLPISFITSFFTINVAEFPNVQGSSSMPLSFVSKYIFGVGLGISIPLILVAFAAQDFKLGFRALFLFFKNISSKESTSGAVVSVPPAARRGKTRPQSPGDAC